MTPLTFPPTLGSEVAQGQHYMLLDSYESKSAVAAHGHRQSSIALFIPPNSLSTTIAQNYEGLAGGALMGGAGAGIQNMEWWKNVTDQLGKFATGGAEAAEGALARGKTAGDFTSAGFGLAKNNHMALVYRGPSNFREHSFQFDFFPKNRGEAETVKKILKDFQDGSTPRMTTISKSTSAQKLTAPFFKSPRQWKIKFMMGNMNTTQTEGDYSSGNKYLFSFKTSDITSMAVNHDPQSIVGFHKDGSPVQTRLSLTFKEIEYVLSGDGGGDITYTTGQGVH